MSNLEFIEIESKKLTEARVRKIESEKERLAKQKSKELTVCYFYI